MERIHPYILFYKSLTCAGLLGAWELSQGLMAQIRGNLDTITGHNHAQTVKKNISRSLDWGGN